MEEKPGPPTGADLGRKSSKVTVGPELMEATGRTQPGPERGSSHGRLGDLGGCDHRAYGESLRVLE